MTCLPGYPCAAVRALLKTSRRHQNHHHHHHQQQPPPPVSPPFLQRRFLGLGKVSALAGGGAGPSAQRALEGGFRPARVAVVAKTTRYEFEQQRYRYAGLSEEDLKQLTALSLQMD